MAVAQASARPTAADLAIAAIARVQREQRQQGDALVSLLQNSVPKPGVGQNLDVYA